MSRATGTDEPHEGILLGTIHIHEGVPLYKFDDIQMVIWHVIFLFLLFIYNIKFNLNRMCSYTI